MRAGLIRYVLRYATSATSQIKNLVVLLYFQVCNQIVQQIHVGLAVLREILAKNACTQFRMRFAGLCRRVVVLVVVPVMIRPLGVILLGERSPRLRQLVTAIVSRDKACIDESLPRVGPVFEILSVLVRMAFYSRPVGRFTFDLCSPDGGEDLGVCFVHA